MLLINDLKRLGDILVKQTVIESEQLHRLEQTVLKTWKRGGKLKNREAVPAYHLIQSLSATGDRNGKLSPETVMRAVAKHYNLEFKKLDPLEMDAKVVTGTIPKPFALKNMMVPLFKQDDKLVVAVTDPERKEAIEQIRMVSNSEVEMIIATKEDVETTINSFFSFSRAIRQAEENVTGTGMDLGNLEQLAHIKSEADISSTDRNIQNAVDTLLRDAMTLRSSDIHIEPKRDETVVRNRIDGVLAQTHKFPKVVHSAITSRIKLLARMNISEKRRPQDGRIKVQQDDKETEMRVSVMPVAFGEKVVIRIFDNETAFNDLDELGFFKEELDLYKNFLGRPHGMALVTGPTGSGKTTTLYSSMKYLNSPDKNLVTVEDPIEMVVPEFNQVGVQNAIEMTFAVALRAILRQDPDIIMIGEIRDTETAEIAVKAALTGHLVLSTLHTNDTASSLTRLLDLGIEPYLIKTSLIGVLAQRLVRVICDECKTPHEYDSEVLSSAGISPAPDLKLFKGKGCDKCRKTGYYGRKGVHEILEISGEVREMIAVAVSEDAIKRTAERAGIKTIQENAVRLFLKGDTTMEEILKLQSKLD